jgi:coiled-coil domain-containing protein 34
VAQFRHVNIQFAFLNHQFNFKSFSEREREKKRLAIELHDAKLQAQRALEQERKEKSEEKIREWTLRKQIEAEARAKLITEMKKSDEARIKPKLFKKAINFDEWLVKKNKTNSSTKTVPAEKKEKSSIENSSKHLSTTSLEKWSQRSLSVPKPVPIGKGLQSLRGSTSKIHVNPEPWKFEIIS